MDCDEKKEKRKRALFVIFFLFFLALLLTLTVFNGVVSVIFNIENVDELSKVEFEIYGDERVVVEYGDNFLESGYFASEGDIYKNDEVIVDMSEFDITKLGQSTIKYIFTDSKGVKHELIRVVEVVDLEAPLLVLKGNTELVLNEDSDYTEYGYTVSDNYDDNLEDKVVVDGNVDTSKPGEYIITYSVTDASGNTAVATRVITVVSKESPQVTLELLGDSTVYLELYDQYEEVGYRAYLDNTNYTSSVKVTGSIDNTKIGVYTLKYSVYYEGKTTEVSRKVIVIDTTLPSIEILGDNPYEVVEFSDYLELGYKAVDNYDGDITSDVIVHNYVDMSNIGEYNVIYTVSDSSGNTVSVNRRVVVINNDKPKILSIVYDPETLTNGNVVVTITSDENITITGWVCNDNVCSKEYIGNATERVIVRNDAGDRRSAEISFDNIDKAKPNVISIEYSTVEATRDNVIVTLTANEDITINNWTCNDNVCTMEYSSNIIEMVQLVDKVGNTSSMEINIENIDREKPVITLNGDSVISHERMVDYRELGSRVTDNYSKYLTATISGSVDVMVEGSYVLSYDVCDSVGLCADTVTRTVVVTDTKAPELVFSKTPNGYTEENVVAIITGDEEISISGWDCNGVECRKTYLDNGSETVTVNDFYGHSTTYEVIIDNIDRRPIKAFVSYTPSTLTNQNVEAVISADKNISVVGWNCSGVECRKVYTDNITEIVTVNDFEGNAVDLEVIVNNIDRRVISIVEVHSPDNLTKEDVTVTITASPTDKFISIAGWSCRWNYCSKTYTENMTDNISITDSAGNVLVHSVVVDNIDKSIPIIQSVDYSPKVLTKIDVIVSVVANENITATGWSCIDDTCTKSYSTNISETVLFADSLGNEVSQVITVDNIDKDAPVINRITLNPSVQTRENVAVFIQADEVITIPNWVCSLNICSKVYDVNSIEVVAVSDVIGNITNTTVTVDNIDREAPVMTLNGLSSMFARRDYEFVDPGVTITDNHDINLVASVNSTVDVTTNGVYSVTYSVCDEAGNCATEISRVVEVVDNPGPILTLSTTPTEMTNQSVTATVVGDRNITIAGWTCIDDTCTRVYNSNVLETVTAYDENSYWNELEINIQNIDTEDINVSIHRTPASMTNQNVLVTVTAIRTDKVISIPGWSCTANSCTKEYIDNINEIVSVTDTAGNSANVTIAVNNIDRVAPVVESVVYEPATEVSKTVTVTVTGNEAITIDGYTCYSTVCTKEYNENVDNQVISVKDMAGNIVSQNINITNIDSEPLIIESITKSTNDVTRGNVVVTVTLNKNVTVSSDWSCIANVCKKTYSNNISEAVVFTDIVENTVSANVTVDNIDILSPRISLIGDHVIDLVIGDTYNELGAVVYDNISNGLLPVITSNVDTSTIGTYYVSYDACDSVGNCANTVRRRVEVTYGDAPVIEVDNSAVKLYLNESFDLLSGVTATDTRQGDITPSIVVDGTINTSSARVYTITYNVSNVLGVTAETVTRTVEVLSISEPEIILDIDTSDDYYMEVNTNKIKFNPIAYDKYGDRLTFNITDTINTRELGTYTVTFEVVDSLRTNSIVKDVHVVDTTAPVLKFDDSTVIIDKDDSYDIREGLYVRDNYTALTVDDVSCVSNPPFDSSITGIYAVTCSVSDSSGNTSVVSKHISVVGDRVSIYTANQLYNIGKLYPLDGDFVLMNDIDLASCSATADLYGAVGNDTCATNWVGADKFTGSLDGQGFTISNLSINSTISNRGLFISTEGTIIRDITFNNPVLVGRSNLAVVSGSINNTAIENITVNNVSITGKGNYVGGIVGVASNDSIISNSIVTGSITNTGSYTGGIAGEISSTNIYSSTINGTISAQGYVGGVVGRSTSESVIEIVDATINMTGSSYVGGVVGNATSLRIISVDFDGSILGSGSIGGIVGTGSNVYIETANINTDITSSTSLVGGISGSLSGTSSVIDANYNGDITNVNGQYVAGAIGSSTGTMKMLNTHIDSNITKSSTGNHVGGLFGYIASGSIYNSSSVGSISAENSDYVGGIVGEAITLIVDSTYTQSEVTGKNYVGGFIGELNRANGKITESYASGNVIGNNFVGGFIGHIYGGSVLGGNSITDSFASGNVTGTTNVGSFIAYVNSDGSSVILDNVYALGKTKGDIATTRGLIGVQIRKPTATNSYWIYQTTEQLVSDGNTGTLLQLSESIDKTNYNNWDFDSMWAIDSGLEESTPYLKNLPRPDNVLTDNFVIDPLFNQAGTGREDAPFELWNADQVNNIRNQILMIGSNYKVHYKVMDNIDMSSYPEFIAIPDFHGEIDGQNYIISNLTNTNEETSTKGLFSNTKSGTVIKDLNLTDVNFSGKTDVSALVVDAVGITVENVSVSGSLTANSSDSNNTTGVLGNVSGNSIIQNITVDLDVLSSSTTDYVGILIARSDKSVIKNVDISGDVSGDVYVGALIGTSVSDVITNIQSTANVSGNSGVGGIAGSFSRSTVSAVEVNSNLISSTTNSTGGLVGTMGYTSISNINVESDLNVGVNYAGGIVGTVNGTLNSIIDVTFTGDILSTAATSSHIGGIAGVVSGSGNFNHANANVNISNKVTGGSNVGGLIGKISGAYSVTNSSSIGTIDTPLITMVGGLIGEVTSTIIDKSYSQVNIVSASHYVGGFIANVTYGTSKITESYASGDVTGRNYVAGFIGFSNGGSVVGGNSIVDTFASGNVIGEDYVSAFIANINSGNSVVVTNSYGVGNVTGELGYTGGLISNGNVVPSVTNSYFVYHTTGQLTTYSNQGELIQIDESLKQETYIDWDFDAIWHIDDGTPYLKNLPKPNNVSYDSFVIDPIFYQKGVGTKEAPFELTNADEVNYMRTQISQIGDSYKVHYKVMNDIDMGSYEYFVPIEDFSGELDGQNYALINLTNLDDTTNIRGLFNITDVGTVIKNLELRDVNIHGKSYISTLVDTAKGTTFENITVNGEVVGTSHAAGLVRVTNNNSIIKNINIDLNMRVPAGSSAMLVNSSTDTVIDDVTISGNLVGYQSAGLIDVSKNDTISNIDVNFTSVDVSNSFGGVVRTTNNTTIDNATYLGDANTRTSGLNMGGIVYSASDSDISNVSVEGDFILGYYSGGIVGTLSTNSTLNNATYTGDITGMSSTIGAGVGRSLSGSTINNLNVNANITSSSSLTGMIVGLAEDTVITNSSSVGTMNVTSNWSISKIGGFAGEINNTTIDKSYANVDLSVRASTVGGFVGSMTGTSQISESYSSGNVIGTTSNTGMGGFIGVVSATAIAGQNNIENCFASGNVNGHSSVGSFIGYLNSTTVVSIENVYGMGRTIGVDGTLTKGLIGNGTKLPDLTNGYFVFNTTGQNSSYGNIGTVLTIDEAYLQNSYNNWNFTDMWSIDTGSDLSMPYLKDLPKPDNINSSVIVIDESFNQKGNGTLNDPFEISLASQVHNMINQQIEGVKIYYKVINDIDMQSEPFTTIPSFLGEIDGQEFAISNLSNVFITDLESTSVIKNIEFINLTDTFIDEGDNVILDNLKLSGNITYGEVSYGALFNRVINNSQISNIELDFTLRGAFDNYFNYSFGMLALDSIDTTISNITLNGSLNGDSSISGLVVNATNNDISNITSDLNIYSGGSAAGLVAVATNSTFEDINVAGTITGAGVYNATGGVVTAGTYVTMNNVTVTADIDGGQSVGGIVGRLEYDSLITNSSYTGNIKSFGEALGGIVGYTNSNVTLDNVNANITSTITSSQNRYTGGIIGSSRDTSVTNSSAIGSITGSYHNNNAGGIIGYMIDSEINSSYADVDIIDFGTTVGGLVGSLSSGKVINSYAAGDIVSYTNAGGLVGSIGGATIENSFASGNVTAVQSVGSVIGYLRYAGPLTNVYGIGKVTAIGNPNNIGGFIGQATGGSVVDSYWSVDTTGYDTTSSNLGTPLTQDQIFVQSSYVNWDFTDIWTIDTGVDPSTPYLKNLPKPDNINLSTVVILP